MTSVEVGGEHSLQLRSDGSLWAVGSNYYGQLGDGTTVSRSLPVEVESSGVTSVSAGTYHSLYIKSDGSLWGMGSNSNVQLGDGTTTYRTSPVQIEIERSDGSIGGSSTLYIKAMEAWGNG